MQNEGNKQKPVIFLAFANDKEDNARYLRNLPKELDGLRKALTPAVQAGLCEVVERASATIEQMLDTFQEARYKDRVAIFHYGGHADGYQLLLEQLDGSHGVAHGSGLVSFFAKQKGLKLVFFNGCSTQQQTIELVEAGVPAVVGTSSAIADDIATNLSIRFYNGLAQGLSIDKAWLEALDYIKIQQGYDKGKGEVNTRGLYRKDAKKDAPPPDRLPWEMYYKQGAEIVKDWNLPEAVDNPLFGLPDVSQMFNLPERPYRFLERYSEAHTEIFFGRSYYIRDLYTRAIDKNSAPIILLYGQSGVGKSSLLDAGVLPRLEQVAKVVYIRRNQEKGLLGTLKDALGIVEAVGHEEVKVENKEEAENVNPLPANDSIGIVEKPSSSQTISQLQTIFEGLQGEARTHLLATIEQLKLQEQKSKQFDVVIDETDHSLKTTWKKKEKEALQPFIVILDQAEEVFTRPNDDLPKELSDFLEQVRVIFGDPKDRPIGKLILSYRKEYSAEFDESFKLLQIPREGVFLKHLERRDIIEVITGLTLTPRVKNQYRLTIEPELPVIIADDLLEDKDSSIAPILQILLTKMWNMTEEEELRYFSVNKYQELKKEGILMHDFFYQQMGYFKQWNEKEEASGLALELLNYHTTVLGTAGSRRIEEIQKQYGHRVEVIEPIIKKFQELYLLAGFSRTVTGLAHDTLAPVVQSEYRKSDKKGQRAVRILENRMSSINKDIDEMGKTELEELVLDETDLEIVEAGSDGMRFWNENEVKLIKASQKQRDARQREKRRNRRLIRGAAALIVAMLVIGFIFQQRFTQEIQAEGEKTKEALVKSKQAEEKAKKQENLAKQEKEKATQASKEAEESAKVATMESEKAKKSATEALRQQQIALDQKKLADQKTVEAKVESDNAKISAMIADGATKNANIEKDNALRSLYRFNAKEIATKSKEIKSEENTTLKSLMALTSYLLIDSAYSKKDYERKRAKQYSLEILDALQDALLTFDGELGNEKGEAITGEIKAFALNPANKRIAFGIKNKLVIAEIVDDNEKGFPDLHEKNSFFLTNGKEPEYIRSLAFSPDGQNIAITSTDGDVFFIPTNSPPRATLGTNRKKITENEYPIKPIYKHKENALSVDILTIKESMFLISTGRDASIIVWDLSKRSIVATLKPADIARCFVFSKNRLFAGLRNGSIVSWNFDDLTKPPTVLYQNDHFTFFDIKYLEKKNWLITATDKGEMLFFDLKQSPATPVRLKDGKHLGIMYDIAVSPDEKWIASAGLDRLLKLWDLREIRNIEELTRLAPLDMPNRTGQVLALQFDANSQYLLFSDNHKMQIRSVDIKKMYEKLKNNLKEKQLSDAQWRFYIKDKQLVKPTINY
ncbi:MAG: CHAT domain-containing protein [Cytophagales bacterium]|nr:MAG: CHAT domain-containing protein [Cytophagales bacterium]